MRQVRTALTRVWVLTSADPGRLLGVEAASVLAWVSRNPGDVKFPQRLTLRFVPFTT